jgi:hypothetical protein
MCVYVVLHVALAGAVAELHMQLNPVRWAHVSMADTG